jgi:hypothetical protein
VKKYTLCLKSATLEVDSLAEAQHAYTLARDSYVKQRVEEAAATARAEWPEAAVLTGTRGRGYVITPDGKVRWSRSRRVVLP